MTNRRQWAVSIATAMAIVSLGAAAPQEEQPSPAAQQASYLAETCQALATQYPKNRVVHIVCHGHSVPAGYFLTPVVNTFNAYPHLLHRRLKERYPYAVLNVIVTAIGGETSPRGAKRFDRDVLVHRPDVITIDYGLNDRRVGLDAARTAWNSMITRAKRRGIEVILLTPTPDLAANLDNPDDPLNQHARQIRELAAEHGVALVDSLAACREYVARGGKLEDLMSARNHPNRRGHGLVAEKLLEWFPAPVKP